MREIEGECVCEREEYPIINIQCMHWIGAAFISE